MASFQKKRRPYPPTPGEVHQVSVGGCSAWHALGGTNSTAMAHPQPEVGRSSPRTRPRRSPPHRLSSRSPPRGWSTLVLEMSRAKHTASPRRKETRSLQTTLSSLGRCYAFSAIKDQGLAFFPNFTLGKWQARLLADFLRTYVLVTLKKKSEGTTADYLTKAVVWRNQSGPAEPKL